MPFVFLFLLLKLENEILFSFLSEKLRFLFLLFLVLLSIRPFGLSSMHVAVFALPSASSMDQCTTSSPSSCLALASTTCLWSCNATTIWPQLRGDWLKKNAHHRLQVVLGHPLHGGAHHAQSRRCHHRHLPHWLYGVCHWIKHSSSGPSFILSLVWRWHTCSLLLPGCCQSCSSKHEDSLARQHSLRPAWPWIADGLPPTEMVSVPATPTSRQQLTKLPASCSVRNSCWS